MLPLIRKLLHSFFFDERAARRWIRGGLMAFAASGVAFAEQLGSALGSPSATKWLRIAAILAGFVAGAIQSSAAKPRLKVAP